MRNFTYREWPEPHIELHDVYCDRIHIGYIYGPNRLNGDGWFFSDDNYLSDDVSPFTETIEETKTYIEKLYSETA